MAKVEFTCTQAYKDALKKHAKNRGISVASYVKSAIYDKMVKETTEKGE